MTVNKVSEKSKVSVSTHSWNVLQGCEYQCSYCWARRMKKIYKQDDSVRLREDWLEDDLGEGRIVFVAEVSDIGGHWQKEEEVLRVLEHCRRFDNTYIFGTKNPHGLVKYVPFMPAKVILWVTVESNTDHEVSLAPPPKERIEGIHELFNEGLQAKLCVSMEPLLKFDPVILKDWLEVLRPSILYLGLDSRDKHKNFSDRHGLLPEPSEEEIKWLYSFGKEVCGIVMVKENLWSLLGIEQERMIYNAEM